MNKQAENVCANCGERIPPIETQCSRCGSPIAGPEQWPPAPTMMPPVPEEYRPQKASKLGFMSTIVIGGFAGALLVSIITHIVLTTIDPRMIYDGQYGMIFMATAPLGWLIGSIIGTIIAWRTKTHPHGAGSIAGLLVVGGIVAGPFLGLAGVIMIGFIGVILHMFRLI